MSSQFPLTDIGIVDASYHVPGEAVDVKEWGKENRATDELINLLIEYATSIKQMSSPFHPMSFKQTYSNMLAA